MAGNHIFLLGIGVISSRRGMTRIFGHGLPQCRQPGCKWDAHGHAGRRGRRPLPRTAPCPHTHTARRTRTPCAHLVRRDVLGAPLPMGRHRGRPRARGPPGRRPLPCTAPCPHTHTARHTRTPCPHTHAMRAPGRARRPRRAAPTERPRDDIGDAHGRAGRRGRRPLPRSTPHPHGRARRPRRAVAHGTTSGTPTGTRAAGDVGPYHAPRHVRQRTLYAHLVRHAVPDAWH